LTYVRYCSPTTTTMRYCTFTTSAIVHFILNKFTVIPLCAICKIFHWEGPCPVPCTSDLTCSLKLFSIDVWPCTGCVEAIQNKLASEEWSLPRPNRCKLQIY
jgi:hypothetical protein